MFGFCLILPSTGYTACSMWLRVRLGEKKDKTMSQNSMDFCSEERKEAKTLSSSQNAGKMSNQSQKVSDEQQAPVHAAQVFLRRQNLMTKQIKKQTFREERPRNHRNSETQIPDDFSSSLFQVSYEAGRIMISVFRFSGDSLHTIQRPFT